MSNIEIKITVNGMWGDEDNTPFKLGKIKMKIPTDYEIQEIRNILDSTSFNPIVSEPVVQELSDRDKFELGMITELEYLDILANQMEQL